MRGRLLIALAAAALLVPGAAAAAQGSTGAADGAELMPIASMEVRDLPVAGARVTQVAGKPLRRFTLAAVHWRGSGSVSFRTHGAAGWSAWRPAAPEADDQPDAGSPEAAAGRGWHEGSPWWTGVADRLEVRTAGQVTALKSYTVWSPAQKTAARATPLRSLAAASAAPKAAARKTTRAAQPPIFLRQAWGADELITKPPTFGPAIRFAVIHHTAGVNAYTREQSAAIVRGIQLYHVTGNGWNDIGYSFLVDKFGQVFEGRRGGVERTAIGAHAVGFNAGSVGIAVIGSYGATGISKAAQDAIVQLLAWRLDVAHVDPQSTLSWTSGGNPRFPKGIPVFLRTISGHRDTGFTDCPGDALYRGIDTLAARVAATGLPKIYEPVTAGKLGEKVRFQARLSAYGSWRVTVTDAAGVKVASGGGTGLAVDWTWDARNATGVTYRWTVESGTALAAAGTLGKKPPAPAPPVVTTPGTTTPSPSTPAPTTTTPLPAGAPFLTGLALSSTTLSPNGDGVNDTAVVSYALAKGAFVTGFVLDQSGTVMAQTLFTDQKQSARTISFNWDPTVLPDGRYRFVVAARTEAGEQASQGVDVVVDRTLAQFTVAPLAISPNADGIQDAVTFSFTLGKPALVALRILASDGSAVALPFTGQLAAGAQSLPWDGMGVAGKVVDGTYTAQLTAVDGISDLAQSTTVVIDTVAPALAIVSGPELKLNLSEQASVVVIVDGQQQTITAGPGDFQLPARTTPPTSLSAVATDAAGNASGTVAWP